MKERILEISYKEKLSHLGSVLTALDIIDAVYQVKKKNEKFILSNGHAALAWYVVLEKQGGENAEKVFAHHGVHPDRCNACHLDYSTGSLGHGFPAAVGMALANRDKDVYCLISDGESAEGAIWEALRIGSEQNLTNLRLVINANGWGAYGEIDLPILEARINAFGWAIIKVNGHDKEGLKEALTIKPLAPTAIFAQTNVEQYPFLKGQGAHYYTMKPEDYERAMAKN